MKVKVIEALHDRAAKLSLSMNALVMQTQRDYTNDTSGAVMQIDAARKALLRWIDVNPELLPLIIKLEDARNAINQNLMEF